MKPSDYFRKALKDFFDKEGRGAQKKLADETGLTARHINDFLGERRALVEEDQLKIINAVKIDYLSFLQHGKSLLEGTPPEPPPEPQIVVQTLSEASKAQINQSEYRAIPYDGSGRLAAWSNGAEYRDYVVPESHVMVYVPELKGRKYHNLVALKVGGDSMEPTIAKKSIVVVDLNPQEFQDNKIYVCRHRSISGIEVAIKRVRAFKEAKGFALLSDNQEYEPVLSTQEWRDLYIGRVIWVWRSLVKC